MATLRGKPVDRPAVSFYEIGGCQIDPADPDPFNIFNAPDWQPLLQLAEDQTDLIRMRSPIRRDPPGSPRHQFFKTTIWKEGNSRFTRTEIRIAGKVLTQLMRRDHDVATDWCLEQFLKTKEDLLAYLELPAEVFACEVDITPLVEEEQRIGDRGIVMVDTADPICAAAPLFTMEDYTVFAFTEPELFHQLLAKVARSLWDSTETVARKFPGHLWRIYGPEFASEPFLPRSLFEEYVVRYTGPMIESINRHGGFARIHCHGHIRNLLPLFVSMGANSTDPIEPPPQGDIGLAEVRQQFGRDLVLFGNLECSDIEMKSPAAFEKICAQSIRDGTAGTGKGFVLMPSAAPYGRVITPTTMANYETMVRLIQNA